MKKILITFICLLMLFSCKAQVEDYIPSVVRITAQKDFGEDIGAGMIIGQKGQEVFILTAWHVVHESSKSQVLIYREKEKHSAELIKKHEKLDLAILRIKTQNKLDLQAFYPAEENLFEREKLVTSVGHPAGGFWKINSLNKIQEKSLYEEERQFAITPQAIVGGCSGGPVFVENGAWLGMITETSMIEGKCVKGIAIQKWIRENNIPSQYLYFPNPDMVFIKGGEKRKHASFFRGKYYNILSNQTSSGSIDFFIENYNNAIIKDFYIGKNEITVSEFKAFAIATGYKTEAEVRNIAIILREPEYSLIEKSDISWRNDVYGGKLKKEDENLPVIYVSFLDGENYCKWLSQKTGERYRLPFTYEWYHAASSKNDKIHSYYFGNIVDETPMERHARFAFTWRRHNPSGYVDGFINIAPVGSFLPNEFGIYDMYGNIKEWCFELKADSSYYSAREIRKEHFQREMGLSWVAPFYLPRDKKFWPGYAFHLGKIGENSNRFFGKIVDNRYRDDNYQQATCFNGFRIVKEKIEKEDIEVNDGLLQIDFIRNLANGEENPKLKVTKQEEVVYKVEKLLKTYPKNVRIIKRLSADYGNLSFYYLFTKQFKKAEQFSKRGLELYPDNEWIISNLAPALLYQGKYEEAEKIYYKYKDRMIKLYSDIYPFEYHFYKRTYDEYFFEDLKDLEKEGITHPDVKKARTIF